MQAADRWILEGGSSLLPESRNVAGPLAITNQPDVYRIPQRRDVGSLGVLPRTEAAERVLANWNHGSALKREVAKMFSFMFGDKEKPAEIEDYSNAPPVLFVLASGADSSNRCAAIVFKLRQRSFYRSKCRSVRRSVCGKKFISKYQVFK